MEHIYDTIIIGGGPAGLSAGLYASRSRMDTLIIERAEFGGQVATTNEIDNYPGSIENCTGATLSKRMKEQAEEFGTQFAMEEVLEVELEGDIKVIKCKDKTYKTKTIIIASGAFPRLSGFKNETELRGKGVSYCATCDADFFEDLDIAVLGGGDSAISEAIYLSKFGKTVTVIHRRSELRAAKSLQEKAFKNPKIKFVWDTVVEEAKGKEMLESLVLKNVKTGELSELKADGCFVFVGYLPISELYKGKITMNERGDVITDENMRTNIPGVYAAGDIRVKLLRQVITASADGAIAATHAEHYIENKS
ncbi:thioredoxin-disulfide reductase [Clostridium estertheticum]|uniref:Thioredoxin reductase n=2 Tax=Clostridium estertheticum TaxID=238834 RepID=A0A1J0GLC1_9CLOT|nr:thioredoxin-disulfide reductase [Clostridium estertheticum]APC42087.1 thioredoxin-disulfide reductase [Clostridium estertheticum subsp. estertheticum]MBU3073834.1 thioredoxin-disulfide reductase [Clostridium estertheticum]MBU3163927.1 thioredoxin-disulfide reductase [Clostridium estertheticum]MBU3174009.1 thioredoxin-disulfide reductase [Clostridium estertheticum]MBU3184094.1 thioredoxin-disulfide reductase [Clostridium estertheticum]